MKNYLTNRPFLKTEKHCLALLFLLLFSFGTVLKADVITVNSPKELLPYLDDDNVSVKLAPGTYTITAADIENGTFTDYSLINNKKAYVLFLFKGNNSTYDFTDVVINVKTEVFNAINSDADDFFEIQVTGNHNVIKNFTLVDVGSVHDYPKYGCVNVVMDGAYNTIEGFHLTAKGSSPYGYGDAFGKGGGAVLKLNKHSAFLIRGESNHALNGIIIHRSFGHCMFMQAANNPKIEGCYLEGEMRSTDDMLAEEGTGSKADGVDFMTVWGYKLPPGYMMSTGEAGIRAYNAGNTTIDGVDYSRGTSNVTVLNCTIKHLRTGVTIAHATGEKYVEGCVAIGCENGYSLASGNVVNCYADCAYGPVYASTYENDKNYNAEITIIPPEDDYYNGSGAVAYIGGSQHTVTLKSASGLIANQDLKIKVGGDKGNIRLLNGNLPHQNDFTATNLTLHNLTNYPVFLSNKSSNVNGTSGGMVTDDGNNNNVEYTAVSIGRYEAEDYNNAQGVNIENTSDEEGGKNVTNIEESDYMEYEINVPFSGTYVFDYRVAGESDGSLQVNSGSEILDQLSFMRTGGEQSWETETSRSEIFMEKGQHIVRITAKTSGWKLNYFDLILKCAEVQIKPHVEVFSPTGKSVATQESFELLIFPGNSATLQPEPAVGGTWSWAGVNEFSADTRTVNLNNMQPEDAGEYAATISNDCGLKTTASFNISVFESLHIEAEDYTESYGVNSESTNDKESGENVTNINEGDYLEYKIDIPFSGTYNIDFRVASESVNGSFGLSIDGLDIEELTFSATGGEQNWITHTSTTSLYLTEGIHALKITANNAGWKLNWLKLLAREYVSPCNLPFVHKNVEVKSETVNRTMGLMNISCAPSINVYAELSEIGTLTTSDSLHIYYKLDGGDLVEISKNEGSLDENVAIIRGLSGTTLEIIIKGASKSVENYYVVDKISIVETTNQFAKIEAEDFDKMKGVSSSGTRLGSIHPGEWSMYAGLDLTGITSIDAGVGTIYDDAYIEVRLDALDGPLLGTIEIPNTGNWNTYRTASAYLADVVGIHDVYLIYQTESSPNVCNIDWFQLKKEENSFSRLEAENYNSKNGNFNIGGTSDAADSGVGSILKAIKPGHWIQFSNVNLTGAKRVNARFGSIFDDAFVEVRLGASDGELIGTINMHNTGGWHSWETVSTSISSKNGIYDVFFVFQTHSSTNVCNSNWFEFSVTNTTTSVNDFFQREKIELYPTLVRDILTISNAEDSTIEIYNLSGQMILKQFLKSDEHFALMLDIPPGLYIVKEQSKTRTSSYKIIKTHL